MRSLLIRLFFFLCCLSYSIEAKSLNPDILSSFEGDPVAIVYNAVDTISGAYREHEIDLVIPTPAPLIVQRSYSSHQGSWHFFSHTADHRQIRGSKESLCF